MRDVLPKLIETDAPAAKALLTTAVHFLITAATHSDAVPGRKPTLH